MSSHSADLAARTRSWYSAPLHEPPGRVARGPGGQHPRRDVPQLQPVAEEEVKVLGDLEGQQVARVGHEGPLQGASGRLPVAFGPRAGGGQVMALARG